MQQYLELDTSPHNAGSGSASQMIQTSAPPQPQSMIRPQHNNLVPTRATKPQKIRYASQPIFALCSQYSIIFWMLVTSPSLPSALIGGGARGNVASRQLCGYLAHQKIKSVFAPLSKMAIYSSQGRRQTNNATFRQISFYQGLIFVQCATAITPSEPGRQGWSTDPVIGRD